MTAAKKKRTGKAAYEVSTHFFTAIVTGNCRWQTQLEGKEIRWGQRMKGRVAKYYLTDGRRHTDSEGYKTSVAFKNTLQTAVFRWRLTETLELQLCGGQE